MYIAIGILIVLVIIAAAYFVMKPAAAEGLCDPCSSRVDAYTPRAYWKPLTPNAINTYVLPYSAGETHASVPDHVPPA